MLDDLTRQLLKVFASVAISAVVALYDQLTDLEGVHRVIRRGAR